MHMFMGLLAHAFEACSRVLLAGRRYGDVTSQISIVRWNVLSCRSFLSYKLRISLLYLGKGGVLLIEVSDGAFSVV